MSKYLTEPFRIKITEPIQLIERQEVQTALERAQYNNFYLRPDEIFINLLTDSGTGSLSMTTELLRHFTAHFVAL